MCISLSLWQKKCSNVSSSLWHGKRLEECTNTVEDAWFYFIDTRSKFILQNWFIFCFTIQDSGLFFLSVIRTWFSCYFIQTFNVEFLQEGCPGLCLHARDQRNAGRSTVSCSLLYDFDSSFCTREGGKKITAAVQLKFCLTLVWFSCCFRWNMEPTKVALPTTKCPWAVS